MAQGNQRDTATYYHIMEQIRWKTERDLSTTMPSTDCTLVHSIGSTYTSVAGTPHSEDKKMSPRDLPTAWLACSGSYNNV